jgi:uncharacterized protein (TIGR03083 family)
MTGVRDDFLAASRAATKLLRDPAVAAGWEGPSALAEFSVAGLAGHLAYQVLALRDILASPPPTEWIGAELDADINVRIRTGGEAVAADGPQALAVQVDAALDELATSLLAEPNRPVRIPLWGPWSLLLDDLMVTRLMEIAVHSDDLAVSVGLDAPPLPQGAVDTVVDLLARLAVRRHGPTAVIRAFSRAERAPAAINAF